LVRSKAGKSALGQTTRLVRAIYEARAIGVKLSARRNRRSPDGANGSAPTGRANARPMTGSAQSGSTISTRRPRISRRSIRATADRSADLPGRADLPVQPLLQRDSGFRLTQIKSTTPPSRPARGAYRDRHGRWARDAVDAAAVGVRNDRRADFP